MFKRVPRIFLLGDADFADSVWQIQLPDGRKGWVRAWTTSAPYPIYYLPQDIAAECLLREAVYRKRGVAWAQDAAKCDGGEHHRMMWQAILSASSERQQRLEREISDGLWP